MLVLPEIGSALGVTTTNNPNTLANEILGTGVSLVGAPTFTGNALAAGTFTGGLASGLDFDQGILLASGLAADADGPNTSPEENLGAGDGSPDADTDLGEPGDPALDAVVGDETFDATVLELDFEFDGGGGGDLFVRFVFASEEYIDYVGGGVDDVFAFFLDGTNIALVPSTSDRVSVDTVNPIQNSAYYVNNVPNGDGYPVANADTRYDGFTTALFAQALGLAPGTHNMRLAIADTGDEIFDSAVFIERGSFSSVPEPATGLLLVIGFLGIAFGRQIMQRGRSLQQPHERVGVRHPQH